MRTVHAHEVRKANLSLHKDEAALYDALHQEIFNPIESIRVDRRLRRAVSYLRSPPGRALDFGAGTGNIAIRLGQLGFDVVAFDLSREMLMAMKIKSGTDSLSAVVGAEELPFKKSSFSFISVFSVLHHLPDYISVIQHLTQLLHPGGILYLDHDLNSQITKQYPHVAYPAYMVLSSLLSSAYRRLKGIQMPDLDYSVADYHVHQERHVEWDEIRNVLENSHMRILDDIPYLLHWTVIPNPLFVLFSTSLRDLRYTIAVRE